MATSVVDICNSALIHLGAGFITNLTDNSDEARACNQFYKVARDSCLTQAEWGFAKTQQELSKDVATPLFGYAYQYSLPNLPYCLKPLFIENPDQDTDWKVEGDRKLLTDRDGVKLSYIYRNEDVSQYSPLFELALGYLLAAMMAYTITGSRTMAQDMYALHNDVIADAMDVDAQIGIEEDFTSGDLDQVRR